MYFLVYFESPAQAGRKEKKMKLNELKKKEIVRAMPYGKNEITFTGLRYRVDEKTEDVTGVWIDNAEYRPLFIPFFVDDEGNPNSYQLDLLTSQLSVDSYDPDEINKTSGTKIIAHKFERTAEDGRVFTNISFNANYVPAEEQVTFA